MKIGITTVFKTENSGSFLQAWALSKAISKDGEDVCFCNYKDPYTLKARLTVILKRCLKFRFKRAAFSLKKASEYKRMQKRLSIANDKGHKADRYVLGSDTLWNFADKYFATNSDFFTGAYLDKPKYAYSISVGSTSKECFLENTVAVESIKHFEKIAVRDGHTEQILSEIYPKEKIVRTVDPTLLLNKEVYVKEFAKAPFIKDRYLLVYYYGDISLTLWEHLQLFAKQKRLKLVNLGIYESKYDINVVPSPANFITAFKNADYILTNTFHGCVFSLLFNKQFATDGINKKKIEGLLNDFALSDRAFAEEGELARVLDAPIDYDTANRLVEEKREQSFSFLRGITE